LVLSRQLEDYVKGIFVLQGESETGLVATTALAKRLKVSSASVTSMLKKLKQTKLAQYTPYKGVRLTQGGEKIALEILRHHRLLELYLAEVVGMPWDQVHDEAEILEHALSEELEAILFEKLGRPKADPHGDPIPADDGTLETPASTALAEAEAGTSRKIVRVGNDDPKVLRYLGSLGLIPGVKLEVLEKLPFNGPVKIRVGDEEHSLGRELSQEIFVSTSA
jgi:DtxR family Mn-dependent transcriptional regulator